MDLSELTMILESVSPIGVSQKEFEDAASASNNMTNIPTENKLQLYGLFKQSTIGNITKNEPPTDYIDKLKWEAWKSFDGYPQQSAANAYVFLVNALKRDLEPSKQGTENEMMTMTLSSMSTFQDPVGDEGTKEWTSAEELCQHITARDLDRVLSCLADGAEVNMSTPEGLTPLHFAADTGDCPVVTALIRAGAAVNAQDDDGQTPLMLAAICDHKDVVQLLLDSGADAELLSVEGKAVYQLEDLSEDTRDMISKFNSSR